MPSDFDSTSSSESGKRAFSRRATLEYFNPAGAGSRFRRMFGAREKLFESVKTLMWVIPLTLLIWIYAERQQQVPNPVVVAGVGIEAQSSNTGITVHINGADEPTVTLKLTGPQEGVRRVFDELTQHIPRRKLKLVIPGNAPFGPNVPINVADSIQNQDLFKSNGVVVQEVQPAQLSLNIDTLGSRSVTVKIPPDRPDLSTTRIDPPNVTVTGPTRVLEGLDLKAYLRLDGFSQLKNPTPGEYKLQSVPVELSSAGRSLQVDPNHVDATVVVAQSDETYEIPDPVYIWIDARPVTLDDYSIKPADASILKVQVKGPKAQIEKIRSKEFIPVARLKISSNDAATKTSVAPEFDLPPGVEVVSESSKKAINFTATQLH